MAEPDEDSTRDPDVEDELRTIGFRLREIQRMLGVRVEQENRRMEADGIDPVSESEFFRADQDEEA